MIEFKIELEEKIVEDFGYKNIENYLKELSPKLQMQLAAKEMMKDFSGINLENDEKWKVAQEEAWNEQKDYYLDALKKKNNA